MSILRFTLITVKNYDEKTFNQYHNLPRGFCWSSHRGLLYRSWVSFEGSVLSQFPVSSVLGRCVLLRAEANPSRSISFASARREASKTFDRWRSNVLTQPKTT
jgi:hypothetical protein